ncbi:helix-turn-helix domain-containing protein [Paenibacillus sp. J5C_2022]|uniref:helix-turn-helix domain-containing protein n=1 Tax=Paenibacillus sp. J5C2022 TaxID=2977129 RepID=UPI0021D0835D|nr:helix-turn-helix domain-containing protein [Paenibacillus sp. J5C2022]MCU6712712.1 helix-turn-helix domain-containing protein [Paenibacillus sp. J5C2022]
MLNKGVDLMATGKSKLENGKSKSISVFYKYLLSYTIVLVVPLLVLGVFGYHQLEEAMNRQVRDNQLQLLEKLEEDVDGKWTQMNEMAGRMSVHPMLTPYSIPEYFSSAFTSNPFVDYLISGKYLSEIVYYIRGEQYLYSSASTYPLSMFLNEVYPYRQWEQEEFMEAMNGTLRPFLQPAEPAALSQSTSERYITYIVPVPLGSTNPYGTAAFVIKEKEWLDADHYLSEYGQGSILVFDADLRLIASHGQSDLAGSDGMEQFLREEKGQFAIREEGGTAYYWSQQTSATTGWTYVVTIPVGNVMKPIDDTVRSWLQAMALILALGGFLTFGALYYNYYPIKKLVNLAEKYWERPEGSRNELEAVGSVISRAAESNRALGRKMEQSRDAVREHMLSELLKGQIEDVKEWNRHGELSGIQLNWERVRVMVLEGEWLDRESKRKLSEELYGQLNEHIQGFCKDTLEEHRLIVVLTLACSDAALEQWIGRLHRHLQASFAKPVVLGVGNEYDSLKHAGRSWIEASTAADYKLVKGGDRVIFFRELGLLEEGASPYARQELDRLSLLIKQGETTSAGDTVRAMMEQIRLANTTLVMARCLCYDMIITVMNVVHELKLEYPRAQLQFPEVWTLMNFDTIEELTELMTQACTGLAETVRLSAPEESEGMIDKMVAYIRANGKSFHFSVQQMADDFSVSTSYLSRYFKEKTGSTLSEYVHQYRIEQAKRLLVQDDRPVKELIQHIGYADPSSFTRKFKLAVGMTPAEYRKWKSADR